MEKLKTASSSVSSVVALLAVVILFTPSLGVTLGLPRERISILVFAVLTCLALYRSSRPYGPAIPKTVVLYTALATVLFWWLMITSLWTVSQTQVRDDLGFVLVLITVVLALTFSFTSKSIQKVLFYTCLASSVLGVYILGGYLVDENFAGDTGVLRRSYLTIAMAIGIGAVGASLQFVALMHASKKAKWLWGAAALLLLVALSLSLARGALISGVAVISLFTLAILLSNPPRLSSRRWLDRVLGMLLLLAALSLTVFLAFQVEFSRVRLEELLSGEIGLRRVIWETALSNLGGAGLIGHGLGSNGLFSEMVESGYPHNLFLQVWLDAGLIGVLLLLFIALLPFLLLILKLLRRQHGGGLSWLPFLGIYLFLLLEYSKSFNFYTARPLFIFGICAVWLLSGDSYESNYISKRDGPREDVKANQL